MIAFTVTLPNVKATARCLKRTNGYYPIQVWSRGVGYYSMPTFCTSKGDARYAAHGWLNDERMHEARIAAGKRVAR